jgi:hypothetical protein
MVDRLRSVGQFLGSEARVQADICARQQQALKHLHESQLPVDRYTNAHPQDDTTASADNKLQKLHETRDAAAQVHTWMLSCCDFMRRMLLCVNRHAEIIDGIAVAEVYLSFLSTTGLSQSGLTAGTAAGDVRHFTVCW